MLCRLEKSSEPNLSVVWLWFEMLILTSCQDDAGGDINDEVMKIFITSGVAIYGSASA